MSQFGESWEDLQKWISLCRANGIKPWPWSNELQTAGKTDEATEEARRGMLRFVTQQACADLRRGGWWIGNRADPCWVWLSVGPEYRSIWATYLGKKRALEFPTDDRLDRLLKNPEEVETYIGLIRESVWGWVRKVQGANPKWLRNSKQKLIREGPPKLESGRP